MKRVHFLKYFLIVFTISIFTACGGETTTLNTNGEGDNNTTTPNTPSTPNTPNTPNTPSTPSTPSKANNPPVIILAELQSAKENQTQAFTFTASDADGDRLVYTLTGEDASSFGIAESAGMIEIFIHEADYEIKKVYHLTVNAFDGTDLTEKKVTFNVLNVIENVEMAFPVGNRVDVAENQTTVVKIVATGDNPMLYSLVNVYDYQSFEINVTTGVIRFKNTPDFETKQSYSIQVKALNNIGSQYKNFIINLLDNNDAPKIITTLRDMNISKNTRQTALQVKINDEDRDDLTLTIDSNNTGIITTALNWTNYLDSSRYNNVNLTFNLNTNINATGKVRITLNLNDGTTTVSKSFIVRVYSPIVTKFSNLEYKEITSPTTRRIWLDRNLGASKVCTSISDADCYGYHYQYGRATDGHQLDTSSMASYTARLATLTTVNSDFVLSAEWLKYGVDNNGSLREASWSRTDGNNTCPTGFRVPTINEFNSELVNITNVQTAFNSFLKLGGSGYRNLSNAWIGVGSNAYIWTSTPVSDTSVDNANYIFLDRTRKTSGPTNKGHGMAIRCIKDNQ
jgi:hypothetical protein